MVVQDFRALVSKCDFLLDSQKERLMGMLGEDYLSIVGVDNRLCPEDVLPIVDNVLWRTTGIGLESMPPADQLNIRFAVLEAL